jgi:hypothetical protein
MINFHQNAPTWFPNHQHDNHHKIRSDQMKMPLYDDSGWGIDYLTSEQIDQVNFDCLEKYETLLEHKTH